MCDLAGNSLKFSSAVAEAAACARIVHTIGIGSDCVRGIEEEPKWRVSRCGDGCHDT